jgi:hypothetical protein
MKSYINVILAVFSLSFTLSVIASENTLSTDEFLTELSVFVGDNISANSESSCTNDNCLKLIKKMKKYANWGSHEAQVLVATAYLTGNGMEKNEKLAVRHLRKAILSGSNRARWMMSYLFKEGIGIDKDLNQSERLLNKAAQYNYPPALFQKAVETINFEETNNEGGLSMLMAAANKQHKVSMYLLAKMYQHGKGVSANNFEAAKLYKKLSYYNYRDSSQQLRFVLSGVKKNKERAPEMLALISDIEVIEVIGERWSIEVALEYKLNKIMKEGIYDGNSYGSHLRGRTCLNSSSKCILIEGEDIAAFMGGARKNTVL